MRSEICVPLKVGTRVLGVFDAESPRLAAFTEDDERLLSVLASHVAGAVERLRSAEALRESGELYRAYFTASPIALFVSDTRGQYLEVNGAACALTGYGREELVGMSIADVLAGEDARGLAERLVGLLALGSGRGEIRIRRKDGSVRHCLVHASTIGADRLLGLLLDITDRKEAEEKLRESEERFRSLSEAGLRGHLRARRRPDRGRQPGAVRAGGLLVARARRARRLRAHRPRVPRAGVPEPAGRVRPPLRDRGECAATARASRSRCRRRSFPYRGQVHRVVAIRDISERKKSERVRESLIRELEAKNAELERFGYTVTHDLKAPLVTIRGFADYVEKDAREGRTDRLAADAARIAEAVGRLQQRLDELFELSRAGRPVGPPVAVPVADLVQEALRLVRGRPSAPGARVEVAGPLPVVFGDRARLVQVFQNLLDNAVKFAATAAEPRVVVEARAGGRRQGRPRRPGQRDRHRAAPPRARLRPLRQARPPGGGVRRGPGGGQAHRRVARRKGVARVGGEGRGDGGVPDAAPGRARGSRGPGAYGSGRASAGMSDSGSGASRNFRPSRWIPSMPAPEPIETYVTSARVS